MTPFPDVQLLVYAHREDSPRHAAALTWMQRLLNSGDTFAIAHEVLSGFVRIVTHPRIYRPPSTIAEAMRFAGDLRKHPRAVILRPSERHWQTLERLCEAAEVTGGKISDAWLAALAIDHECELQTCDADFGQFEGLKWRDPLGESTTGGR